MKKLLLLLCIFIAVQHANAQSVGIGTNTPNASAQLDITSTTKGFLLPRMTSAQRNAIVSPVAGLMVFDTDFKEYYQHDGSAWRKLLNSSFWNSSSTRSWIYNSSDSVGIGTVSPDEKLHLSSGSFYMQDNRAGKNPFMIFDVPAVDFKEAGIQFRRSGDTLAAVKYVADPNLSNYIKISVGNSGRGNDLVVNSNGDVSIGTRSNYGNLTLGGYDGDNLGIYDADGIIQFSKAGIPSAKKMGFLQVAGDDFRIGTNSGNNLGNFVVRTNGTDQLAVTPEGDAGLGTIAPKSKFQVTGGQDAGLSNTSNGYVMVGEPTGAHLLLDNNEIMVRGSYTTPGTLAIQNDGGTVTVGAKTIINTDNEALALNGNNAAMNFYQNNVFKSFIAQSNTGLYVGVNGGNLRLDATGQVAIGGVIAAASGYKLTVTGKVICEELKVKLSGAWPDYVFANEYRLKPLSEVAQFIASNKHLPNIPAAAELEKNGMEIGDMQKKMMEKIEELTLYVIDLQKQLDEVKKPASNK